MAVPAAVNVFHLLAVVPLLVYLSIAAPRIPRGVRIAIAILGALLILYHGARAMRGRVFARRAARVPLQVPLIHVLIAGPLFLYLGLASSPPPAVPFAAAILVALFHGARLAQKMSARGGAAPAAAAGAQSRAGAERGSRVAPRRELEADMLLMEEFSGAAI